MVFVQGGEILKCVYTVKNSLQTTISFRCDTRALRSVKIYFSKQLLSETSMQSASFVIQIPIAWDLHFMPRVQTDFLQCEAKTTHSVLHTEKKLSSTLITVNNKQIGSDIFGIGVSVRKLNWNSRGSANLLLNKKRHLLPVIQNKVLHNARKMISKAKPLPITVLLDLTG